MQNNLISLDEFVLQQIKEVVSFRDFWISRNQLDGSNYPMNLLPGDWIEQLDLLMDCK